MEETLGLSDEEVESIAFEGKIGQKVLEVKTAFLCVE